MSHSFRVVKKGLSFDCRAFFTEKTYVDEIGLKFIVFVFITFYLDYFGGNHGKVSVLLVWA